jgi:hypothetical protein
VLIVTVGTTEAHYKAVMRKMVRPALFCKCMPSSQQSYLSRCLSHSNANQAFLAFWPLVSIRPGTNQAMGSYSESYIHRMPSWYPKEAKPGRCVEFISLRHEGLPYFLSLHIPQSCMYKSRATTFLRSRLDNNQKAAEAVIGEFVTVLACSD